MNNKIRLMHVVECACGVDRYLCMLTSRMNRERFMQVHEMQNALSPSKDGAAVKRVRTLIRQWKPDVVINDYSRIKNCKVIAAIEDERRMAV